MTEYLGSQSEHALLAEVEKLSSGQRKALLVDLLNSMEYADIQEVLQAPSTRQSSEWDNTASERKLTQETIDAAFQTVLDTQSVITSGGRRRKPVRVERVWEEFKLNSYEPVSLDHLAERFGNSRTPRKTAASAISWLNRTWRELGVGLNIESSSVRRINEKRTSTYYFFAVLKPET